MAGDRLRNGDVYFVFQNVLEENLCKWLIEFQGRVNKGHLRIVDFKKVLKLLKKVKRACSELQFLKMTIQSERSL